MELKAKNPGDGLRPAICTPLVGKTCADILGELAQIVPRKPDIIEWRADFFQDIHDSYAVLDMAKAVKDAAGEIPLIFTIRSAEEGGQCVPLPAWEKMSLNIKISNSTAIEYIDCELANDPGHIELLRKEAHTASKKIIASFHQCGYTPDWETLLQKIIQAEEYALDVAKIAVMPRNMQDVLLLLSVLLKAKEKTHLPVIAIAMGRYGLISRLAGGIFGCAATFAVGHSASAPGQVDIDDLRIVLDIIEKNMDG